LVWVAPSGIWTTFFGSGFEIAGKYNFRIFWRCTPLRQSVFSLSVVIVTFEMSYKIANTSWVQLAFSGVGHRGHLPLSFLLREVILVQLVLMVALTHLCGDTIPHRFAHQP
jgi:hypothetical protein